MNCDRTVSCDNADLFKAQRPRLNALAYHMLGRKAAARDLVQDAYLKWRDVDAEEVDDPESYLRTIVARMAIDRLRSSRARREEYDGPWLPEPVATGASAPDEELELETSLSYGLLHVLERLNPVERAVFLLREAFDRTYEQIADVVHKTPVNCRQIAHRARERLDRPDPRFEPAPEEKKELLERFMGAVREGKMDRLVELLEADAVHYSDGGGRVPQALAPIDDPVRIARFLTGLNARLQSRSELRPLEVNGEPGYLVYVDGALHSVWTFEVTREGMRRSFAVLNPEKIAGLDAATRGTRPPPG